MRLTDEQVEIISKRVEESNLKLPKLRDDIVDHLCCVVEHEMAQSKDFQNLLAAAISELAPNGFKELERKTVFLLNSNKILFMKKLLFSTGFLGALVLTLGTVFKILHYPGANVMFIVGLLLLLLVFVPLFTYNRYKLSIARPRIEKLQLVFGAIAAIVIGFSGVFKVLHLMGGNILMILGTLIFAFGFLPMLFISLYRRSVG